MAVSDDVLNMLGVQDASQAKQLNAAPLLSFDISKKYGTPDQILDNLGGVESSNNPFAVNKESKAIGKYQFLPETASMLHKKGIKFNPFDEKESRAAADYYIQQLVKDNGGDYKKAMAAYGGFKTADPSSYVNKVLKGVDLSSPQAAETPTEQPGPIESGVMEQLGFTPEGETYKPIELNIETTSQSPSQYGGENPEFTPEEVSKGSAPFAAAADVVAGGVAGMAKTSAYWLSRMSGMSPEEAEKIAQRGDVLENPIGKFSGLINTPEYQNSLPMQAANLIGQVANYPGQKLSEATGLHPLDAQYGTNFLMMAVPEAAGLKGAIASDVARGAEAQAQGVLASGRARAAGLREEQAAARPPELGVVNTEPVLQKSAPEQLQDQFAARQATPGSVGAAGATPLQIASASGASPQLIAAIQKASKSGDISPEVVTRHVEADTLPVPMQLREGQATRDPAIWADEYNKRTDDAAFRGQQNQKLVQNFQAIDERARPSVTTSNAVQDGEAAIEAYKAYDAPIKARVDALYKDLEKANGGDFPMDAALFAQNTKAALKHDIEFLPPQFIKRIESYESGEPMDFGEFDNLRTRLSAASRTAARQGDGNMEHALSIVRDQLEALPIKGTAAAEVKPIADAARSAARERFQELNSDPAYKAALNDVAPDNFTRKYIISAPARDVASMRQKFSSIENMPDAPQIISAAALRHIQEGAIKGVTGEEKWTSQATYNKRLDELRPKANAIFDPQTFNDLDKLGRVASYIESPPAGAAVNTSGTATVLRQFMQQAKGAAAGSLEGMANVAAKGVPVGTAIRKGVEMLQRSSEAKKANQPYRGLNYQGAQTGETNLSGLNK